MTILIAAAAGLAAGLLLLSILFRFFGNQRSLSFRLTQYININKRSSEKARQATGLRGIGMAFGRLAPKSLSTHYNQVLQKAAVPLKGEEMAAAIAISSLVGMLFGGIILSVPGWFIGLLVGSKLPGFLLKAHIKKRLRTAEEQLVDFMLMTANAMRAGHSFLQALELAAKEMPSPIGSELSRTLREVSLGLTVEEALLRLVDRLPTADLDLLVTAVLIQRQVGGDLASILDGIATTIRERQRIKAEVNTLTAQGRLSGWVISLLPIVIALMLNMMNPEYISLLWKSPVGILMLGVSVVSMTIGIFFIRKIVQIEV